MAVGLSATNFADVVLNYMLRQVAGTVPAANYVQLHTSVGDPGAAGTSNVCINSGATRVVITMAAPTTVSTTRSSAASTTPTWASWTGTSVTISYISVWSAITAGNFLYSAALTTPKAITDGDTFTLSSLSVALGNVAA